MIRRQVTVEVVSPYPGTCWADLCYDPDLPMAVEFEFADANRWTFARDLLDESLHGDPAGLGDIRLMVQGRRLMVALSSDDGDALFAINASQARRFLLDTYRVVPRGREAVDVDYAIAELFDGAE